MEMEQRNHSMLIVVAQQQQLGYLSEQPLHCCDREHTGMD